jgi:hypothetical protein
MITETEKAPPQTLGQLAASLATLAGYIDWITEGLEDFPFTKQTDVLLARMEQTEVDGPLAAFRGFTYAWILAKMPELTNHGDALLDEILSIEDHRYRDYVVLSRRHIGRVSLLLPRVFSQIDQTWAAKGDGE